MGLSMPVLSEFLGCIFVQVQNVSTKSFNLPYTVNSIIKVFVQLVNAE